MPVKVTTAPISVRPLLNAPTSAPTSKGSRCSLTVAVIADQPLSAGHRRKERDLAGAGDARIGTHMSLVDRRTDHFRILERIGIAFAARSKPSDEIPDGRDIVRGRDIFLRQTDALAHPGKIAKLHA